MTSLSAPTASPEAQEPPQTPTPETLGTDPEADAWDQFADGFLHAGGDPAYVSVFRCILELEADYWLLTSGNGHYTRAQFAADTYARVSAWLTSIGVVPSETPYVVGLGVAWWVQQIGYDAIATPAGWPVAGRMCGL